MSYHLFSERMPVAAKDHRCIWCGEVIPKGEKHRHEISKYDGNWQRHRWHLECDKAAKAEFACSQEEVFEPHCNERPSKT